MRDPALRRIQLHRMPLPTVAVLYVLRDGPPEKFPKGGACAWCRRIPQELLEMWCIEFYYEFYEGAALYSQYCYTCTQAHAALYMLSWWNEYTGGLYVG